MLKNYLRGSFPRTLTSSLAPAICMPHIKPINNLLISGIYRIEITDCTSGSQNIDYRREAYWKAPELRQLGPMKHLYDPINIP